MRLCVPTRPRIPTSPWGGCKLFGHEFCSSPQCHSVCVQVLLRICQRMAIRVGAPLCNQHCTTAFGKFFRVSTGPLRIFRYMKNVRRLPIISTSGARDQPNGAVPTSGFGMIYRDHQSVHATVACMFLQVCSSTSVAAPFQYCCHCSTFSRKRYVSATHLGPRHT
jgi:hypothetical protein